MCRGREKPRRVLVTWGPSSLCKVDKRSGALSQFRGGQSSSRLCQGNAFAQPGWKLSLVGLLSPACLDPPPCCHSIAPHARQEPARRGRHLHPTTGQLTPRHQPFPMARQQPLCSPRKEKSHHQLTVPPGAVTVSTPEQRGSCAGAPVARQGVQAKAGDARSATCEVELVGSRREDLQETLSPTLCATRNSLQPGQAPPASKALQPAHAPCFIPSVLPPVHTLLLLASSPNTRQA